MNKIWLILYYRVSFELGPFVKGIEGESIALLTLAVKNLLYISGNLNLYLGTFNICLNLDNWIKVRDVELG